MISKPSAETKQCESVATPDAKIVEKSPKSDSGTVVGNQRGLHLALEACASSSFVAGTGRRTIEGAVPSQDGETASDAFAVNRGSRNV